MLCRARKLVCDACPVRTLCAWRQAGYPAWAGALRRGQSYVGTDRRRAGARCSRCFGQATSRSQTATRRWRGKTRQRNRALASLVQDGLVVATGNRWSLPG